MLNQQLELEIPAASNLALGTSMLDQVAFIGEQIAHSPDNFGRVL